MSIKFDVILQCSNSMKFCENEILTKEVKYKQAFGGVTTECSNLLTYF